MGRVKRQASPISDDLARAFGSVTSGQVHDALGSLLAAWRKLPAAELASAVEHVGAIVDKALPPIPAGAAGQDEWLAVASKRDHADVGRLLASLVDTFKRMRPRLEALAEFDPDPRIASALMALEIGTSSQSSGPIYTTVFAMLEAIGDGRVIGALKARLPRYKKELDTALLERVPARVTKLLAKLEAPPKLDADDLARVTAIGKMKVVAAKPKLRVPAKAPATSSDALIAAVQQHPDDDAARAVLADTLQECNDPRGEFIALQLAARDRPPSDAEDKKLRALVKEHGRKWIAPLDAVVDPNTIRFERGFLDSVVVKRKAKHLAGNPMWSTVRELECHELEVITDPVMRALRRIAVEPKELSALARRDAPLPFETALGRWLDGRASVWAGIDPEPDDWKDALAVGALANLTGLSIDSWTGPDAWAHLPGTKLAKQLRRLDAAMYGWSERNGVGAFISFAEALGKIERLVVRQSYEGKRVTAALDKTKSGWEGVLQVNRFDLERQVVDVLTGAKGKITKLRVELVENKERFDAAKLKATFDVAKKYVSDLETATARAAPAQI